MKSIRELDRRLVGMIGDEVNLAHLIKYRIGHCKLMAMDEKIIKLMLANGRAHLAAERKRALKKMPDLPKFLKDSYPVLYVKNSRGADSE